MVTFYTQTAAGSVFGEFYKPRANTLPTDKVYPSCQIIFGFERKTKEEIGERRCGEFEQTGCVIVPLR